MIKLYLLPNVEQTLNEKCRTCMLTKITRQPFPKIERKTNKLELIHSDVCDLHNTPTLGNKKYFATFIDDCTRFLPCIFVTFQR